MDDNFARHRPCEPFLAMRNRKKERKEKERGANKKWQTMCERAYGVYSSKRHAANGCLMLGCVGAQMSQRLRGTMAAKLRCKIKGKIKGKMKAR